MAIRFVAGNPAVRMGIAIAGTLVILLAIIAVVRPDMMSMKMVHDLIVGFGL